MSVVIFVTILLAGTVGGLVYYGMAQTQAAGFAWGVAWMVAMLLYVLIPVAFG